MFNIGFRRTLAATIGTLLFTAVSIGAAAGPARVIETSPVAVAYNAAPVAVHANV